MGNFQTTQALGRSVLETPEYLDLIQTNIEEFNKSQEEKCEELKKTQGKEAYQKIMWSDKHHELKARRTIDYSLTPEQIQELRIDGLIFKQLKEEVSFARQYLDIYNNDLPVFITSDSMLHALHKFYDNYLMNLENNLLANKLITLCENMLNTLYTITVTEQNERYLRDLEVFFLIPYTILQLNNDLPETINTETKLLFSLEEIKALFTEPSKERIDKTKYSLWRSIS